jgi:hypothetical protein
MESGFFIFEILALVMVSLAGKKCDLSMDQNVCGGGGFVLEF